MMRRILIGLLRAALSLALLSMFTYIGVRSLSFPVVGATVSVLVLSAAYIAFIFSGSVRNIRNLVNEVIRAYHGDHFEIRLIDGRIMRATHTALERGSDHRFAFNEALVQFTVSSEFISEIVVYNSKNGSVSYTATEFIKRYFK